ncbi:Peptidyl-dipeptidase A precursor [Enhygromyxa salina]|uniref:Peptidyl-dipeptidase A n=1 Tax=Enhygromyxa salina TaxID=215803 RepID=A0A0C2A375_9BACT|nr:M2 family metallopeptidase [Enhygromyxa salina]KIG17838.1 Peptidyl-dipeptidase A precursor [Enhygromyxa salina]
MRKPSSPPLVLAALASSLVLLGCSQKPAGAKADGKADPQAKTDAKSGETAAVDAGADKPTPEQAKAFVTEVDAKLRELWTAESKAAWTNATDITDEHAAAVAAASEQSMAYIGQAIKDAREFDGVEADPDTLRQLHLLKVATTLPAPNDPAKRKELAETATKLDSMYGSAKWGDCSDPRGPACKDMGQAMEIISSSDDYDELLAAWEGWRTVAPPMRPLYQRFAELGNEGARDIGYKDVGELWRSGYDMTPAEFEAEMERLWQQVKPLYTQLHCHARAKLGEKYGVDKVPADGMIPAHLVGNLWAQEWPNIYDDMIPYKDQPSIDVTEGLKKAKFDEHKMVKTAEGFFVSLGMDPLPDSFWERSLFVQPEGRDVQCHASAWDVDYNNDLRIKMCIKIDMEDFVTIHHELGHNYYYQNYYTKPMLFQAGANDGFHEGIGDTLALSVTPAYLQSMGLLSEISEDPKAVINKQLADGLEKIAFLPFGLLIDRWRWGVFSGEIKPEEYNAAWWKLRNEYQGVAAPVERSEADFDPGAKYHIPANTPYARYFLARILQFQFHKALCDAAGHEGPLHTCSIYGSKEAGKKLKAMLAMGASQPWPAALEAIAGTRKMDAGPMLEYFEPLQEYLSQENQGRTCGW